MTSPISQILSFLILVLIEPPLNLGAPRELPHYKLGIILHECHNVVLPVANQTNQTGKDGLPLNFVIAGGFHRFPLLEDRNSSRFLMNFKDSFGPMLDRTGTCSVRVIQDFLVCSFTFENDGAIVNMYALTPSKRIKCLKDTSSAIKVWDQDMNEECIVDFGSSCCVYDPLEKRETYLGLPVLVFWTSVAILVILGCTVGVLKAMEALSDRKKNAGRPQGPWMVQERMNSMELEFQM